VKRCSFSIENAARTYCLAHAVNPTDTRLGFMTWQKPSLQPTLLTARS
jgi:hypothetical protein